MHCSSLFTTGAVRRTKSTCYASGKLGEEGFYRPSPSLGVHLLMHPPFREGNGACEVRWASKWGPPPHAPAFPSVVPFPACLPTNALTFKAGTAKLGVGIRQCVPGGTIFKSRGVSIHGHCHGSKSACGCLCTVLIRREPDLWWLRAWEHAGKHFPLPCHTATSYKCLRRLQGKSFHRARGSKDLSASGFH